jgi:hypothetical protein
MKKLKKIIYHNFDNLIFRYHYYLEEFISGNERLKVFYQNNPEHDFAEGMLKCIKSVADTYDAIRKPKIIKRIGEVPYDVPLIPWSKNNKD